LKAKVSRIWGYIGGTFTTVSLVPQLLKILESKETKDISFWMYLILSTGVFLWVVHGIRNRDRPVILFNVITLAFTVTILILKCHYG